MLWPSAWNMRAVAWWMQCWANTVRVHNCVHFYWTFFFASVLRLFLPDSRFVFGVILISDKKQTLNIDYWVSIHFYRDWMRFVIVIPRSPLMIPPSQWQFPYKDQPIGWLRVPTMATNEWTMGDYPSWDKDLNAWPQLFDELRFPDHLGMPWWGTCHGLIASLVNTGRNFVSLCSWNAHRFRMPWLPVTRGRITCIWRPLEPITINWLTNLAPQSAGLFGKWEYQRSACSQNQQAFFMRITARKRCLSWQSTAKTTHGYPWCINLWHHWMIITSRSTRTHHSCPGVSALRPLILQVWTSAGHRKLRFPGSSLKRTLGGWLPVDDGCPDHEVCKDKSFCKLTNILVYWYVCKILQVYKDYTNLQHTCFNKNIYQDHESSVNLLREIGIGFVRRLWSPQVDELVSISDHKKQPLVAGMISRMPWMQ